VAALRGGVRRCARVRAVLALALGANRSACVHEALAREKIGHLRGCVGLATASSRGGGGAEPTCRCSGS